MEKDALDHQESYALTDLSVNDDNIAVMFLDNLQSYVIGFFNVGSYFL